MKCPICSFEDFKETPKKFICNLCGKTVWKEHQKGMIRKRRLPIEKLKEELGEDGK